MRKTIYYQRGMPDPVLEAGVVLDIVRQYIPEARSLVSIDDTHGEARVYAVDKKHHAKSPTPSPAPLQHES